MLQQRGAGAFVLRQRGFAAALLQQQLHQPQLRGLVAGLELGGAFGGTLRRGELAAVGARLRDARQQLERQQLARGALLLQPVVDVGAAVERQLGEKRRAVKRRRQLHRAQLRFGRVRIGAEAARVVVEPPQIEVDRQLGGQRDVRRADRQQVVRAERTELPAQHEQQLAQVQPRGVAVGTGPEQLGEFVAAVAAPAGQQVGEQRRRLASAGKQRLGAVAAQLEAAERRDLQHRSGQPWGEFVVGSLRFWHSFNTPGRAAARC
jgi:hypothetical protein